MIPLRRAIAAWAAQPRRARCEAVAAVRLELNNALYLANASSVDIDELYRPRFLEDVRAMRAAIALLLAAEKPARKVRRK